MSNVPPAGDQPDWSKPSPSQPTNYGGGDHGNQGGYGGSAPAQPSNGIGIAAMVVGIVALPLALLFFPLGLVLGIVAIVLGIVGIRKVNRREATNKGMAIAGVATGAVALVIAILVTIFFVGIFNSEEFQNIFECTQNAQTVEEQQECQEQFEQDFGR
ncbi:MAG TPA: DUF4190 domain-containing protein [Acidimicrobiales bacterium]|nr:DUF4190 domain-containing protein [Acidimicrobiales bacterium]